MATLSKNDQYRCVSAGFALGLLANGCNQIPNDKPTVEFAFTSAWRKWSHRGALPAADQSIAGGRKDWDVIRILLDLDKDKRKPYVPFHWEEHTYGVPTIIVREAVDFDPTNDEDVNHYAANITDNIPAKAWRELAHAFLEKLNKD